MTPAKVPPATPQLLPVTVSQLLSAPQGGHDAFFVGSLELNQVSLVGVIRSSAPTETNVQYSLDDMTGPPLVVKQWVNTEATPISPGSYVKVVGYLRLCEGQRFLLALSVRCLQDPNEVTSHMLEVVQAHMQLLGQAFDVNMNPNAAGVPPNGLSTIQGQVLRVVRTFAACRDGVSFHTLRTQLRFLSEADLRSAVAFLLSEGHIYSPDNQHHFKSMDH